MGQAWRRGHSEEIWKKSGLPAPIGKTTVGGHVTRVLEPGDKGSERTGGLANLANVAASG